MPLFPHRIDINGIYISDVQRMSLEVMTLQPVCDKVETIQGKDFSIESIFFFGLLRLI